MSLSEINSYYDDFRYYFHNYFRTQEEAETYARVLETEMLLKKYADEHNGEFADFKYYLFWVGADNELRIDFVPSYSYRIFFIERNCSRCY